MPNRRRPRQQRALETIEAILAAVVRIAKREGVDAITTNHIAEVAGVSVGSVYQYFADKRAIVTALHDRHVEQIGRVIDRTVIDCAGAPLEAMLRALVEALIDAHAPDPELYALLAAELPPRGGGLQQRLRNALRLALAARGDRRTPRDLERVLFVVAHVIEALAHGAVLDRPPQLSLAAAKTEAVRAVVAYLRA